MLGVAHSLFDGADARTAAPVHDERAGRGSVTTVMDMLDDEPTLPGIDLADCDAFLQLEARVGMVEGFGPSLCKIWLPWQEHWRILVSHVSACQPCEHAQPFLKLYIAICMPMYIAIHGQIWSFM